MFRSLWHLHFKILLLAGAVAFFIPSVSTANASVDLLLQQALVAENGERDIPKAIHLYEEALQQANGAQPSTGQILLHLAMCYERLSKIQEALLINQTLVHRAKSTPADIVEEARANAARLEAKMASALNPRETKMIFAGGMQSAAIQRDGSVLWWGRSDAVGESHRPILLENVVGASTLALNNDGLWVLNQDGVLSGKDHPLDSSGSGSASAIFQPDVIGNPRPVVLLTSGQAHHLAARNDGTIWSWGANERGQLGNNSLSASTQPVLIPDLKGVIAVAAGSKHSLALKGDGSVWGWGSNEKGQLGMGSLIIMVPHPKQVPGLTSMVAIAAGADHSIALRSDGTVWIWGDNSFAQLGDGTHTPSFEPSQIKDLTGVEAIAAGPHYTLALKSNGTIWVWGDNTSGALGVGDIQQRIEPIQMSYLLNVQAIAAGANHNIAIQKDGTVWAWGRNNAGQIGDGATEDRLTPVKISSPASTDL